MSWILSRRNKKESIYTDGHGAYTVITHSRGICNEKITPPLAMKKDREGFNGNTPICNSAPVLNNPYIAMTPSIATDFFNDIRPIATEKTTPRVQHPTGTQQ